MVQLVFTLCILSLLMDNIWMVRQYCYQYWCSVWHTFISTESVSAFLWTLLWLCLKLLHWTWSSTICFLKICSCTWILLNWVRLLFCWTWLLWLLARSKPISFWSFDYSCVNGAASLALHKASFYQLYVTTSVFLITLRYNSVSETHSSGPFTLLY